MLTDAQRTHVLPNTTADMTYTFVVNFVSTEAAAGTPDTQAVGFNLDDRDSGDGDDTAAACADLRADYVGIAPDAQSGVDNQLGGLLAIAGAALGACTTQPGESRVDCLIRNQLAQGSLILLVTVSGVNDFMYDDQVSVQLGLGVPTTDADPAMDGVQPMTDTPGGRISAGQTFMMTQTAGPAVPGDIFAGRLNMQATAFPLTIMAMGLTITLPVANPTIRFDIDETGLSNGVLGGAVGLAAVAEIANQIMPGPACDATTPCTGGATCRPDMHCPSGLEATIFGAGADLVDIDACTTAADCPWAAPGADICTKLSLGLRLEATTATIQ